MVEDEAQEVKAEIKKTTAEIINTKPTETKVQPKNENAKVEETTEENKPVALNEKPQETKEELVKKSTEVKAEVAQKVENPVAKQNIIKTNDKEEKVATKEESKAKVEIKQEVKTDAKLEVKADTSKEVVVEDEAQEVKGEVKQVNTEKQNEQPKESLLDKLIDDSLHSVEEASRKVDQTVEELKSTVQQNNELKNQSTVSQVSQETQINDAKATSKEPILANMYMSIQRHIKDLASMKQKSEGKDQAVNAKTVEEIKNSAKTLELNPDDPEFSTHQKKVDTVISAPSNDKYLNRLAFTKNIMHENLAQMKEITKSQSSEVATNTADETVVEVTVNPTLAQSIQTRIIGAKQHMSQMMSDIARQMVENYKPPVTTFRINLNPSGLGHIAVLMRSERDNGLTIKMNISNSATLDAMVDSQGALRASLSRSFDMQQQNFTLDFGMDGGNTNDQFAQQNSDSQQQPQNQQEQNAEVAQVVEETPQTNSTQYL